ncbi:MAG: class I SAM-dependent methyltransferase [Nanoarchaeota archaeon]|nr:class I SAM-dependent methyltransferase [Nanoarchaeota archaeon]
MNTDEILSYWEGLWTKDDYYVYHDISLNTDGISQLLLTALKFIDEGSTLLEIGSGPGTRSIPIAKDKGLQLTLVDKLESAHNIARKRAERYGVQCGYVVGDAIALPLENESYDVVLSIGLNEHFFGTNRYNVFSEMHRVTKKGGRTVVIVPNKYGTIRLEQVIKEANGTWMFGPTDLFNHKELKAAVESFKFSHIEMYGVSAITSFVRLLPQKMQRAIFKNEKLWTTLVNLPGNFGVKSNTNKYFGEEIMAVGYK